MTITALAMPAAPRQFAIVLDEDDDQYAEYLDCCRPTDPVLWWGCAVDGRALLYRLAEGRLDTSRHTSPESALAMWERIYPVKLVWL